MKLSALISSHGGFVPMHSACTYSLEWTPSLHTMRTISYLSWRAPRIILTFCSFACQTTVNMRHRSVATNLHHTPWDDTLETAHAHDKVKCVYNRCIRDSMLSEHLSAACQHWQNNSRRERWVVARLVAENVHNMLHLGHSVEKIEKPGIILNFSARNDQFSLNHKCSTKI